MPKHFLFAAFFAILILAASGLSADTVTLINENEVKGLVVDEYVDRVVVSTFEGEKTFFRKDIQDIEYEDEEARLLKLASAAMSRGKYKNAIYYYEAVLKLNPNSAAARDGEVTAVRKQLGGGAEIAREEIDLMLSLDQASPRPSEDKIVSYEKNVQDLLGLKIKKDVKNNTCYVEEVMPGSLAANYGIRKNDIVGAVWNDNVKYMNYEGVMNKLSGPEFSMIKLGIERKTVFANPEKLKWDIGLSPYGYFIKELSGAKGAEKELIEPGDWILEINSVSTRYMPKDELNSLLSTSKAPIILLIKRNLYMNRDHNLYKLNFIFEVIYFIFNFVKCRGVRNLKP